MLHQRCGLAETIAGVSLVKTWARISIFLGLALLIMQKALNFPMQDRIQLQDQALLPSGLWLDIWTIKTLSRQSGQTSDFAACIAVQSRLSFSFWRGFNRKLRFLADGQRLLILLRNPVSFESLFFPSGGLSESSGFWPMASGCYF